mgnify:CR=1 FL=1
MYPYKAVICGCTKNSASYIYRNLENLYAIKPLFSLCHFVLYENDSHDDTVSTLQRFKENHSDFAYISEKNDKSESAIASQLAAKIYNLEVLKSNIEDESGNVTRFFVMGKDSKYPESKNKKYITSCIFKLKSIPAALYKALGGFATNGINMTKLESYVDEDFIAAQFYADVDGHPEEKSLRLALEELRFYTHEVTILGVYRAHPFRLEIANGNA